MGKSERKQKGKRPPYAVADRAAYRKFVWCASLAVALVALALVFAAFGFGGYKYTQAPGGTDVSNLGNAQPGFVFVGFNLTDNDGRLPYYSSPQAALGSGDTVYAYIAPLVNDAVARIWLGVLGVACVGASAALCVCAILYYVSAAKTPAAVDKYAASAEHAKPARKAAAPR